MKRRLTLFTSAVVLSAALGAGIFTPGCALLGEALAFFGIDLLGVIPADDFVESGLVELTLLPKDGEGGIALGSFEGSDADVTVFGEDGSENNCDFVTSETIEASRFNSVALLTDDSGSMENYYPVEEYGDLCQTCPHDPARMRVDAANDLVDVLLAEAPYSRISVMRFGPDTSADMDATMVLEDFTNDGSALDSAISGIGSSERAGTPLWQSLTEIILALDEDADMVDDALKAAVHTGDSLTIDDMPDPEAKEEEDPVVVADPEVELPSDVDVTDEARRIIVVITDGDNYNLESDISLADVIRLANENEVTIHAIRLGPASQVNNDPLLTTDEQKNAVNNLQQLAGETGGFYASVHDASGLRELYSNIAMSLSQGYNESTFDCSGTETVESGDRVNGEVTVGDGMAIPFSFLAP